MWKKSMIIVKNDSDNTHVNTNNNVGDNAHGDIGDRDINITNFNNQNAYNDNETKQIKIVKMIMIIPKHFLSRLDCTC